MPSVTLIYWIRRINISLFTSNSASCKWLQSVIQNEDVFVVLAHPRKMQFFHLTDYMCVVHGMRSMMTLRYPNIPQVYCQQFCISHFIVTSRNKDCDCCGASNTLHEPIIDNVCISNAAPLSQNYLPHCQTLIKFFLHVKLAYVLYFLFGPYYSITSLEFRSCQHNS